MMKMLLGQGSNNLFSEEDDIKMSKMSMANNTHFDDEDDSDDSDILVDAFSSDDFRMYEFKIRRCNRGRSHDWTECPFAHPAEKARRRDPRKFHYSGAPCPEFRKGNCKLGDSCGFSHGVFECWLHPSRYRTQPCKDGTACRRRVCFFAHTPEQLRIIALAQSSCGKIVSVDSYDGSPMRHAKALMLASSPKSTLLSPPVSPNSETSPVSPFRRGANEVVESLRQLQLGKVKSMPVGAWSGIGNGVFGSPRASSGFNCGYFSLPSTPTGSNGLGNDGWFEEGERVESGRALRAKMFEKLSRDGVAENLITEKKAVAPDVAWISDLVM